MGYNNQRGFTFIELFGAVIAFGILMTMGIVSVSKVIDKSHISLIIININYF